MFSFMKKVDRNLGKKDLPKINDLKKTALFFGSFSNKYLAFKPLALMGFVGFRRQIAANPSNPACKQFAQRLNTRRCD